MQGNPLLPVVQSTDTRVAIRTVLWVYSVTTAAVERAQERLVPLTPRPQVRDKFDRETGGKGASDHIVGAHSADRAGGVAQRAWTETYMTQNLCHYRQYVIYSWSVTSHPSVDRDGYRVRQRRVAGTPLHSHPISSCTRGGGVCSPGDPASHTRSTPEHNGL